MKTSLTRVELERYVNRLLENHFPDGHVFGEGASNSFSTAFDRVEYCFAAINRKYYKEHSEAIFDHLNGDHMATLLYFYANTVWRSEKNEVLATRLFYLNKIMHGLDLYYSVAMPDIFLLVHPVGTVLGNAEYQDYLVVYQNCTVGAVTNIYPSFGVGTILYSRSSVLGGCRLGDDVILAANAMIIDLEIPARTVVVGQYPNIRLCPNNQTVKDRCFDSAVPRSPQGVSK